MAQTDSTRLNYATNDASSRYQGWNLTETRYSNSLTDNNFISALDWVQSYYNTNGTVPSFSDWKAQKIGNGTRKEWSYILATLNNNKDKTGFDPYTGESTTPDYQTNAFNDYYNDAYSYDVEGTNANKQYNQMVANTQNTARQDALLADATAQQSALQQASVVKDIVNQMKSERRAMLQSGYSPYDIANNDMTTLMNNINQLNANADTMNQARLQANYNYNNAQTTAYDQWLQQANAQATAGSAYAASDAGDVVQTAKKLKQNKGIGTYVSQAQGTSK